MSDATQVQLIATFGVVISTVVTTIGLIALGILNRTRQHSKATRDTAADTHYQLANDHKTNLRDDLDGKFLDVTNALDALKLGQETLTKGQARQGRQISALFRQDRALAEEIEHTRDPEKTRESTS